MTACAEVFYAGQWWTLTNEHNGYATVERKRRAKTISVKLIERRRAAASDDPMCRKCLTRHKSFEWCKPQEKTANG